jgi:hypothetical protein
LNLLDLLLFDVRQKFLGPCKHSLKALLEDGTCVGDSLIKKFQ